MPIVKWEWKLLLSTSANMGSHRIARRIAQGDPAFSPPAVPNPSGMDNIAGTGWSPQTVPPPTVPDGGGKNYKFAFWSIMGGTTSGVPIGGSVIPQPSGFVAAVGMDNNATAVAYYVWDFGGGGGPNAVYIDAYDKDTGWIQDSFVSVTPDDGIDHIERKSLWWKANDGYLNTEAPNPDITQIETLSAFDPTETGYRRFISWQEVEDLTFPTTNGPTINGRDAVVMPSCRLVAFAIYESIPRPSIRVPDFRTTRWWVSHGPPIDAGGIRIGPHGPEPVPPWDPMAEKALIALSLINGAPAMSPGLKDKALDLAADQFKLLAEETRRQKQHGQRRDDK